MGRSREAHPSRPALGLGLGLALAGVAGAEQGDAEMGRRLQEALRAQRGEVHACYAEALTRDRRAQGELLVQIEMGEANKVHKAEILKDQTSAPGLAQCLSERMGRWSLPQLRAAPGDRFVFPLIFKPDQPDGGLTPPGGQVVIPREAATRRSHPPAGGALQIEQYLDGRSHPGTGGAVAVLTVAGGERLQPHRHAGTELLYVLSGSGQVMGTPDRPEDIGPGDGILVPPGAVHALRALGRARGQGEPKPGKAEPLVLVQVLAPAGPGKQAQAEGEPPPRRKQPGEVRPPAPVVLRQAATPPIATANGKCQVRILIDVGVARARGVPAGTSLPASLEELVCEAGVEIPRHQHEGSDELLYIVSGQGRMSAGETSDLPVGPQVAVRVPKGVQHGLVVSERLRAIQSYTPSGPEQRFRQPAPKTR